MDYKKSFMIISLIVCILFSISCVSANDIDNQLIASNASDDISQTLSEDILSMDGDDEENEKEWYDDYVIEFKGDEDKTTPVDFEVTDYPKSPDENKVTFKLNYENETPIGNVDLAVVTNHDFKITKITTDSDGVAVYNIPFKSDGFSLVAGFWTDGKHVSDYTTHNGKTLYSWWCCYFDVTYSEEEEYVYRKCIFEVLNIDDNDTIAGVTIVLSNATESFTGVTNKEGLCGFEEVPLGDCKVKVMFDNEVLDEYEVTFGSDGSRTITISDKIKFGYSSDIVLYTVKPIVYEGDFRDLKSLIDGAQEGSTVNLGRDYIGSGEIKINKNLTINGNGHKIDASSQSRIFSTNSTLTLNNIRFYNGKSSVEGGAIYSTGNLNINGCTFENNEAVSGGAIYAYPSSTSNSFTRCTFKNNKASDKGGAIYLEGSALATRQVTNMSGVTFENNVAKYGGAVCSENKLNIADSDFIKNSASYGGAIYTLNGRISILSTSYFINGEAIGESTPHTVYTLNISGKTTFRNNKATSSGGAIRISSNNYALYGVYGALTISEGVMFESNSANLGGAISIRSCNANVSGATFKSNAATVAAGAFHSNNLSEVRIDNSIFTQNTANEYGGSIYAQYLLYVTDCQFTGSTNVDFIDVESYIEIDGTTANAFCDFFMDNNVMKASNDYDVWYEGYSSLDFKTKLVFKDATVKINDLVNVCELQDMNGNSIRISQIEVLLTNRNDLTVTNLTLEYNEKTKGYSIDTSVLKLGEYVLSGSTLGLASDCTVVNGNLKVIDVKMTSNHVTKVYGTSTKLVVNLVDNNKKALAGESVRVVLNGVAKNIKTNSKGQATLSIGLAPGKYLAEIYYGSKHLTRNVVVKKATPKLAAAKKTFKRTLSTKKFTVTLKDNLGKAMKSTWVTLNVNKKTYKVKTNSKGQATFKITKLTKKGNFKATVKFAGNKYYNAKSVKTVITCR